MAVGRIVKPHGLQGEVSVESWTDFPERWAAGKVFQARGPGGAAAGTLTIAEVRPHAGRLLVTFEGFATVAAADELRGVELCVLPGDEPERPAGYWFGHELEGLAVVDRSGRELGTVHALGEAAGRPLLAVRTPRGLRDVPFCEPIVVSVEPAIGRVVLDPPDGLLD